MTALIGFTLMLGLSEGEIESADIAKNRVLSHFAQIDQKTLQIGATRLEIWGRGNLSAYIHTLHNGSIMVLVGSPVGEVSWEDIEQTQLKLERLEDYQLPWEGRVILLKINPDGKCWTMWNDWLGSIPVFHAAVGGGRVASTVEPVVVATAGFTPSDFFIPGLTSLLVNGHLISDWTLYKGMQAIPPDSLIEWNDDGFHAKSLFTVQPNQCRWESSWDDLVDEMYELSHKIIANVLKTQPSWILPLSAGLDSRLIAAVGADLKVDMHLYTWGEPGSTDVIYARQIARKLGYPWKHIDLPADFLVRYTSQWADMFGSSMHFHGMYQMAFLNQLEDESAQTILTGFLGDMLSGASVGIMDKIHFAPGNCQVFNDWYIAWNVNEIKFLQESAEEICPIISATIEQQINSAPGARFQKLIFFALWSRLRFFNVFQSILCNYWRGVADPFMNRDYARFAMSLPRVALDNRRLLADVFRRHYGPLAVIPGTYAQEPIILTGKYLAQRRIVNRLPTFLHHGLFAGFDDVPLRMDVDCIQVTGKDALWPLFDAWDRLAEWLDVNQLEQDYQTVMRSKKDIHPLRRLQAAQTLAFRLL